jgi:3-deoxy-manno-octulosonate cytidylyltransferase (CMP-KDO synthetase)
MKTLIIIPSRLAATRLPNKPLLKINGLSIISHVFKKAVDANIGEVFVATEDQEIIDDVKKNGGEAILTGNNHKTGTDRIYEALKKLKRSDIDLVLNLQGDEPMIDIGDIKNLHQKMIITKSNFGTLGSHILDKKLYEKQNVVKVITKENLDNNRFVEAINFNRKINSKSEKTYQHLGVYCYQIETLEKFISLEQSQNEIENNLEQFRALDNGIKINVALAKDAPIGVDTEEDFVAIKKIMEYKT